MAHHPKTNLCGLRFGRLLVIKDSLQRERLSNGVIWECLCDCGKIALVSGNSLKRGNTKSCGCLFIDNLIKRNTTHNLTNTSEFHIWQSMKDRCYNPKADSYKYYGGRGIKVCERWINSFENFYEDMGARPSKKHSIERDRVNGDYEPSNCRWATQTEQSRNKSNNVYFKYGETRLCITDWAKKWNIDTNAIRSHLKNGKSFDWIFNHFEPKTTPPVVQDLLYV